MNPSLKALSKCDKIQSSNLSPPRWKKLYEEKLIFKVWALLLFPTPSPHWYTQAMFIKAVWRNGSSTSLCLGAETSWNDLEKNKQHSLTKVQITFNQNIPQRHNGNLSYLVSLGVFNHWKCFIALVTLNNYLLLFRVGSNVTANGSHLYWARLVPCVGNCEIWSFHHQPATYCITHHYYYVITFDDHEVRYVI